MDGRFAKKFPSTGSGNEFFFVLAKQYRATDGGLAARRFFLGWLRERVFFVLAKKVSLRRAQGTFYLRTCQTVQSHGGRLGGAEIFSGLAQGTSFFVLAKKCPFDKLREGGWGIFRRRPTRDWRGGGSRSVGMEGVGAPGTPESP